MRVLKSIPYILLLLFKALLFVPIIIFMIYFSYKIDPSALFQGDRYEREIASLLLDAKPVSNYAKLDERQIVQLYIKNLQSPLSVAVIGSSRAMQLGNDMLDRQPLFNFGVVGADRLDMMNTFYGFVKNEKIPGNTILMLDPWFVMEGNDFIDKRSDKELFEETMALWLGLPSDYIPPDNTEKYTALFSVSYFQGAVRYYMRDTSAEMHPDTVEGDVMNQQTEIKMGDGTTLYAKDFRKRTQEEVDFDALALGVLQSSRFTAYQLPSKKLMNEFSSFIDNVKSSGTNLIFVLAPYHPLIYDIEKSRINLNPGLFAVEDFYNNLAKEKDVPIFGSYNPYSVGCDNIDFYDGIHVTKNGLKKYLQPINKVLL